MADALFNEINGKGEGITSGLRHVEKKKKTDTDPSDAPAAAVSAPVAADTTAVKAGTTVCEGNKRWKIDGHVGTRTKPAEVKLEVDDLKISHAVFVSECKFAQIFIPAKVNTVTIFNCERVEVFISDVVANVEIIRTKDTKFIATGHLPALSIENSESIDVTLSAAAVSSDPDILTTQSSAVNINVPNPAAGDDSDADDEVELPVPEQFMTKIVKGKLVTTAVEHKG